MPLPPDRAAGPLEGGEPATSSSSARWWASTSTTASSPTASSTPPPCAPSPERATGIISSRRPRRASRSPARAGEGTRAAVRPPSPSPYHHPPTSWPGSTRPPRLFHPRREEVVGPRDEPGDDGEVVMTAVRSRRRRQRMRPALSPVMAGLDPATHVFSTHVARKSWVPGTSPGMTAVVVITAVHSRCRRRRLGQALSAVMAGLDPATHVFPSTTRGRRGSPGQARG